MDGMPYSESESDHGAGFADGAAVGTTGHVEEGALEEVEG
jgi:hypothetical protein